MRDFTLRSFDSLCVELQESGYEFIPVVHYFSRDRCRKLVMMRHDVDKRPGAALTMARHEEGLGIIASYYFRGVNSCYDRDIIREIGDMGHEIGYHYEDLALANGDYARAIVSFEENLSKLQEICSVKTICMHGSPLSKWDNRLLWQKFDYRDFGIIGEPYLDIDFCDVLYLTDTGRRWNSRNTNVRDRVKSKHYHNLSGTADVISALRKNRFPDRIMVNVHPHRWTDNTLAWCAELVWQNMKNVGKLLLTMHRR